MTFLTVVGPLLIVVVLGGGANRRWPPDRPIEWVTVLGVIIGFGVVMALCLGVSWRMRASLAPSSRVAAGSAPARSGDARP